MNEITIQKVENGWMVVTDQMVYANGKRYVFTCPNDLSMFICELTTDGSFALDTKNES